MRDVIARAPCVADSTDITQFAPDGAAVQPYDLTNDRHLNIVATAPVGSIRRAQLRFNGSPSISMVRIAPNSGFSKIFSLFISMLLSYRG